MECVVRVSSRWWGASLGPTITTAARKTTVLATRLSLSLLKELDTSVHEVYYWSDSLITLQYVANESRRFPTFIPNRGLEIHENTQPQEWYHVPGLLNSADDCSRGLASNKLTQQQRWLRGPDFLWLSKEHWPPQAENVESSEVEEQMELNPFVAVAKVRSPIIDPAKFSTLSRLLRVTAWIQRFV